MYWGTWRSVFASVMEQFALLSHKENRRDTDECSAILPPWWLLLLLVRTYDRTGQVNLCLLLLSCFGSENVVQGFGTLT
jgi:hypothetical protein